MTEPRIPTDVENDAAHSALPGETAVSGRDDRFDGAGLLDEIEAFMARFVAFPSESARVASVLWCVHAHLLNSFDSTPRLGFLSPEPGSGKTRALEITELLVPNPMLAVSASTAALFRSVSSPDGRPTILFDEIDTVFGPKAKENEELRGLLNAGHRRSGVSYRCVGDGSTQVAVAFPSYAALAMGGLGSLPDTILSRSVIIRMRKRLETETVEPYRERLHKPLGLALRKRIAEWAEKIAEPIATQYPEMPDGVNDRPADVWEPLLMVADAAGHHWPERARAACVDLVTNATPHTVSLGVRLLTDLREIFAEDEKLLSRVIIAKLHEIAESPWRDLRDPLDQYRLSKHLAGYEIHPRDVRTLDGRGKGYDRTDFADAWNRYCRTPASGKAVTAATPVTRQVTSLESVAASPGVTASPATQPATPSPCNRCGWPLDPEHEAAGLHPWCADAGPEPAEPDPP